jgi:hypothetical protein
MTMPPLLLSIQTIIVATFLREIKEERHSAPYARLRKQFCPRYRMYIIMEVI